MNQVLTVRGTRELKELNLVQLEHREMRTSSGEHNRELHRSINLTLGIHSVKVNGFNERDLIWLDKCVSEKDLPCIGV